MHRSFLLIGILAVLATAQPVYASSSSTFTPEQAAQAAGRTATVCGTVSSVHFAAHSNDHPTYVNLGAPYPHQVFTIVIWGSSYAVFKPRPESWMGKKICVTGRIKSYHGTPEIVAYSPDQIKPSPN